MTLNLDKWAVQNSFPFSIEVEKRLQEGSSLNILQSDIFVAVTRQLVTSYFTTEATAWAVP